VLPSGMCGGNCSGCFPRGIFGVDRGISLLAKAPLSCCIFVGLHYFGGGVVLQSLSLLLLLFALLEK